MNEYNIEISDTNQTDTWSYSWIWIKLFSRITDGKKQLNKQNLVYTYLTFIWAGFLNILPVLDTKYLNIYYY